MKIIIFIIQGVIIWFIWLLIKWVYKQFLGSDKYITIENPEIVRDTNKEIHINYNDQRVSLPKSKIFIDQNAGEPLRITMPEWLFNKKFA